VMTLAIGTGSLPWLLSTRLMVYGGQISFCLYMVHELMHTAWIWTAEQFQLTLHDDVGKLLVVGLLAITLGAAIVLFHFVEEPARRWMRRMVDVRKMVDVEDPNASTQSDPAAAPVTGRLQSVDRALDEQPNSISVRAG
jgi:peptidoglycan/LPS O-acetylase OafA/YrhL